MDFIDKLLDEDYDWGDERIDEDAYDELSAELIIDYLRKHDSEFRQMLALSWNFDNPKKVIKWPIVGILKTTTSFKHLNEITQKVFTRTNAMLSILAMTRIKTDMTGQRI